jgi:hypothetical protein
VTPTRQAIVGGVGLTQLVPASTCGAAQTRAVAGADGVGAGGVGAGAAAGVGAAGATVLAVAALGALPPQPLNPKTMRATSAHRSTDTISTLRSATQKLSETAVRVGLSMRAAAGMLSTEPIVLSRDSAGAGL